MDYLVTTAAMHTRYQGRHLLPVHVWCLLMGVRNVHTERGMRVSPDAKVLITFLIEEVLVYLHISCSSKLNTWLL